MIVTQIHGPQIRVQEPADGMKVLELLDESGHLFQVPLSSENARQMADMLTGKKLALPEQQLIVPKT